MGYKQHGSVWSRPQQWIYSDSIQGPGSRGSTGTAGIGWHLPQHGVDCSASQQVGSLMSLCECACTQNQSIMHTQIIIMHI